MVNWSEDLWHFSASFPSTSFEGNQFRNGHEGIRIRWRIILSFNLLLLPSARNTMLNFSIDRAGGGWVSDCRCSISNTFYGMQGAGRLCYMRSTIISSCLYLQRRGGAINWNLNLGWGTRQVLGQPTIERPAIISPIIWIPTSVLAGLPVTIQSTWRNSLIVLLG